MLITPARGRGALGAARRRANQALPRADEVPLRRTATHFGQTKHGAAYGCSRRRPAGMLCSVARDVLPLSGMVPMYLLTSAFHLAPWLKLRFSGRSGTRSA